MEVRCRRQRQRRRSEIDLGRSCCNAESSGWLCSFAEANDSNRKHLREAARSVATPSLSAAKFAKPCPSSTSEARSSDSKSSASSFSFLTHPRLPATATTNTGSTQFLIRLPHLLWSLSSLCAFSYRFDQRCKRRFRLPNAQSPGMQAKGLEQQPPLLTVTFACSLRPTSTRHAPNNSHVEGLAVTQQPHSRQSAGS